MNKRTFARLKYEECLELNSLLACLRFKNTFMNKKRLNGITAGILSLRCFSFSSRAETCAMRHPATLRGTPTVCVNIPEILLHRVIHSNQSPAQKYSINFYMYLSKHGQEY
jgi:hypothetical protein